MNKSISTNSTLVRESPLEVYSTDKPTYTITFPGVTTILDDATLIMTIMRGNDDVTATYSTGTVEKLENTVTLKTLQNLVGGDVLHITCQATCDGTVRTVGFDLFVKRLSGR